MAWLIFKCRYLKSGGGAAGYLKYIATREGVEISKQRIQDDQERHRRGGGEAGAGADTDGAVL